MSSKRQQKPRRSPWYWVTDAVRRDLGWTPEARAQRQRAADERRERVSAECNGRLAAAAPTAPHDGRSEARTTRPRLVINCALVAIGAALWLVGALVHFPRITAVRVEATVLSSRTTTACNERDPPLRVSFGWHGRVLREDYYAQPCDRDYLPGEELVIYAASNDPTSTGPDSQWILDPAAHDPFDFIGPNGLPGFLELAGLMFILGGAVPPSVTRRARLRSAAARSTGAIDAAG